MPILHNERPLFRIKFKDANIREVRRGTELEWGLYEITYFTGSDSIQNTENITEYVWGYPGYVPEDFTLTFPEGDDYIYGGFSAPKAGELFGSANSYRTGGQGWYSEPECLTYIPAITREFHKDLLLFCKWTQRQYRWSGTITNKRYTWIEGGGGSFTPKTDSSGLGYGESLHSFYWDVNNNPGATADGTYRGTNCLPNCTTYAYGRCLQLGIGAPVKGFPGAGRWADDGIRNFDKVNYSSSSLEEGDILVWKTSNIPHVAVYEGGGMVSASGWSNTNHYGALYNTMEKISNYWYGTARSDPHAFNYKTIRWESDWVGGDPDYILKTSSALHGGGGGEGYWGNEETQSMTLAENICGQGTWAAGSGTQNFPRAPQKYDQEDENRNPGAHWRTNQKWDPLNTSTWERSITYEQNSSGSYNLVFSNWEKKYSGELRGEEYPGWDTELMGPLEGWKMYWGDE